MRPDSNEIELKKRVEELEMIVEMMTRHLNTIESNIGYLHTKICDVEDNQLEVVKKGAKNE